MTPVLQGVHILGTQTGTERVLDSTSLEIHQLQLTYFAIRIYSTKKRTTEFLRKSTCLGDTWNPLELYYQL